MLSSISATKSTTGSGDIQPRRAHFEFKPTSTNRTCRGKVRSNMRSAKINGPNVRIYLDKNRRKRGGISADCMAPGR